MKQKYWKILSFIMLIMTFIFSVAVFMGHSDAIPTAIMCLAANLATFGASERAKGA